MRIRQIELSGFKSFRNRTVIRLGQGISGVIGPNGCGKSNIVDALLWVMGETAPGSLRSNSMEDVIFAGSSTRNISGVVEVSLVMEQSDKCSFPEPYKNLSELMITRRLDRDGKSEYLINSNVCRLKDVQEIFMDTGVGRGGFGFMEQGSVEQFIASRPEKKRLLVESAAGIAKFRLKKKEAQKKLELTQVHLNRLQDILKQQEHQLKKLQKQSQQAKSFRHFKAQVQSKDIQISQWNLMELQNKIIAYATTLQKEKQKKTQIQKNLDQLKKAMDKGQLSRKKILVQQEREKVEIERRELFGLDKKLAATQAFLEAAMADSKEAQEDSLSPISRHQDLMKQLQDNQVQIKRLQLQSEKIVEQVKHVRAEHQKREKKVWQTETRCQQLRAQMNWLKTETGLREKGQQFVLQWGKNHLKFVDAFQTIPVLHFSSKTPLAVQQAVQLLFWDRLQALLCSDERAALEIIADLKSSGVRNCRFVFTKSLVEDEQQKIQLRQEEGFQYFLTDCLENKNKKLFFSVAVVSDMIQAARLKTIYPHWAFIALAGGTITHQGEWIVYDMQQAAEMNTSLDLDLQQMEQEQKKQNLELQQVAEQKKILEEQKESVQERLVALKEKNQWLSQALKKEQQMEKLSYSQLAKRSAKKKHLIDHYASEVKSLVNKKQQLERDLSQREMVLSQIRKEYEKLEQSMDQMQSDIIEQHQNISSKDQMISEVKLQEAELVSKQQALFDRIRELYQIELSLPEDTSVPSDSIRQQEEQELIKLNDQLSRMGEVNLLALKEYEELEQKKDFYQKQYQDLCDSAKQLQEVIQRMDSFCSRKFRTVFDRVNHCFSKVFPALFDGGRAELILIKDEGVEVLVQPAGKRIQNMNLLSGGEKAMTALAVIFSLFMVKPSPFCILDEVDASLDDANIARFSSLLLEIAAVCKQVILITHNRHTMQICHRLYGVTMEEKGVSKLLSLDMKRPIATAT